MELVYQQLPIFLYGFSHALGGKQRDLEECKREDVLANEIATLSKTGYRYCFGLEEGQSLVELAMAPVAAALRNAGSARALVFQHCHAESAVLPAEIGDETGASHNRYFAAAVLRELKLDELPYFCSFASGCAGFLSLLITAAGLFGGENDGPVVCAMADSRPEGVPFDLLRERILGSDHSSAFVVGRERRGYQLLGLSYYSTTRTLVPLVEIVKRTVEMIQSLAAKLKIDLAANEVLLHYPNIFPDTWKIATKYLRLPRARPIIDEMAGRAHCGASDSVISLAKFHRGEANRVHVVVNYGVGLHFGVCLLQEQPGDCASGKGG